MKLMCNIEVNDRTLYSANVTTRKKVQRGCITIARQSVKNNDICLLLQTSTNKQGTKYKIVQNIDKVFTKFVNDGKATIRIKEPPHDLNIQCDTIQLKSFLHVLKLGLSKGVDPSVLSISNTNPKKLTLQKTKVVITKKSDYPVLEGFPRTTESLCLAGLERKSFDRQILKLHSLRVLDLSNNQLTSLPNELGGLPNLTELYLGTNQLGASDPKKWSWMNGPNISKTLRLLDISNNCVHALPDQIRKLSSLVTLKVGGNLLVTIPQSIGRLISLKYLELQKNRLECLPGSMANLRLVSIDVSHSLFSFNEDLGVNKIDGAARLVELAASVVIDKRIHYDAGRIPLTLVTYLDGALHCVCGKACFHSFIRKLVEIDIRRLSSSVKTSYAFIFPFDCHFCSVQCMRRYSKNS